MVSVGLVLSVVIGGLSGWFCDVIAGKVKLACNVKRAPNAQKSDTCEYKASHFNEPNQTVFKRKQKSCRPQKQNKKK